MLRYFVWLLILVKLVLPPGLTWPGSVGYFFGDLWQWDGNNWNKLDVAGPSPRARIAMASQGDGKAIMFGGDSSSGPLDEIWEWNGKQLYWKKAI